MSGKNREGGKIEGELDEWVSTEMRCLNTGPNWIWSKMTLKGICYMQVVKVNLGMRSFEGHSRYFVRQLPRSPGCAPWEDEWPAEHRRQLVSSHPASLTLYVMCLSLLPQHGARCFPTYRLLSKASGPSGRTKPNRGFRSCSTHTRTCTQVCGILEMISKDGMCCLLRPDLPLRQPCRISKDGMCCLLRPDLPLRQPAGPHLSLCRPASPSVNLPPPPLPLSSTCVLPSPPGTPLLLLLLLPYIVQLSPHPMALAL